MNNKIKIFTDLIVWKRGHELVLKTYSITKLFPKEERYSLADQMRRASVSITSNIAEGFGRRTYREKVLFYYHAHGSLTELKNQFIIARDLTYINNSQYETVSLLLNLVHKLLQGLMSKTKSFIILKS